MSKKVKIGILIVITIIIGILGYSQVLPIIVENPKNDFIPIQINEANNSQDNNMALSFLYNITKGKHPTGSKAIYNVRDYIIECLEQMNVEHEISIQNLDEKFFLDVRQKNYEKFIKIKNKCYVDIKEKADNGDVEKFIKEETGYNSFNEFYEKETLQGKDIENILKKQYENNINKYANETLNNIIIKVNANNNINAKNIMFVAHYDSVEESYGAGDNGISVAGILEAIRCLKEKQFNNNIYVMFTDGEEESLWGANDFIQNNNIDFDLIINFDNSGNRGNLVLYHYSNNGSEKQYFESVKKERTYSFANDLLCNPNSKYYQGEISDAFVFIENGYNTIDLALVGNPLCYHTKEDNFYNTDVKALDNLTKSIIEMMCYYGNNDVVLSKNIKLFNFTLINGFVISINQKVYIIITIILIVISGIYAIVLFTKKGKVIKKIITILFTIIAIVLLCLFKNFSLLFLIPSFIMLIFEIIKNKKIKEILKIVLFESYFFVVIQCIILIVQYIIWLIIH